MLIWRMNRTDLQLLADDRLADAEILLANGRFGAAYYLAGYAVECALKACIAKLTKAEDFPIKNSTSTVYMHDLKKLASPSAVPPMRLAFRVRRFIRRLLLSSEAVWQG